MAKELKFDVYHPGEVGAGIVGYTDAVTVTVENDPGGEDGEFEQYMRECVAEWFDGARVTNGTNCPHCGSADTEPCSPDANGDPCADGCRACGKGF